MIQNNSCVPYCYNNINIFTASAAANNTEISCLKTGHSPGNNYPNKNYEKEIDENKKFFENNNFNESYQNNVLNKVHKKTSDGLKVFDYNTNPERKNSNNSKSNSNIRKRNYN